MPLPLDIHAETLAQYLKWLNTSTGGTGTGGPVPEGAPSSVPVFTWMGKDYQCNFGWTERKYFDQGGFVVTSDLVIEVLEPMEVKREDGVAGPALKDILTFQGRDWRVEVLKHVFGKNPQITCWDPARGS